MQGLQRFFCTSALFSWPGDGVLRDVCLALPFSFLPKIQALGSVLGVGQEHADFFVPIFLSLPQMRPQGRLRAEAGWATPRCRRAAGTLPGAFWAVAG